MGNGRLFSIGGSNSVLDSVPTPFRDPKATSKMASHKGIDLWAV
jgi:hypothetical protein